MSLICFVVHVIPVSISTLFRCIICLVVCALVQLHMAWYDMGCISLEPLIIITRESVFQ